jgi:uncharacterized membrane-anchored protein
MSGANLDGYNTPREGIHKAELIKRVDKIEADIDAVKDVLYELITLLEQWVNKNENTESLRPANTTD